ncbi:CRISPR-associated protein (Cas_APE2256) [Dethiosulfovibrio salsuginis]|uniref:CRISPR-associated protein (Cas_APE2256) n=2 Tax=Dethiosulfovibrio salsuginis TaxID=561720 RepID=A0A1X7KVC2_9BACT|nr:CRISPR-associated protein (Cas_APE2256) [Dethiosulfovibrio salsuginis]
MAEDRKIVMLCTVGTSVATHLEGNDWSERSRVNSDKLGGFSDSVFKDADIPNVVRGLTNMPGFSIGEKERGILNKVRSGEIDKKKFVTENLISAEVQSTLGHISRQEDAISLDLHLYPSRGGISFLTALYCVWYLKEVHDAKLFPNWKDFNWTVSPLDIKVGGAQEFHKSVNSIFEKFDEIRAGLGARDSLVINMTGGYKSISAYASLYSLIYDIPAIYAFGEGREETRETFDLMPLPVSCAIGAMDEEISLLKGLCSMDSVERNRVLKNSTLPSWVRGLFVEGSTSSLAKSLIEQYKKGQSQVTGSGRELLSRLKKVSPCLGNYMEKLIETRWSDLWMGDQIPETVEHSRRHSKRIMEIAGNVMRSLDRGEPLGEGRSKDLYMDRPIPLALLISAIYLHDIGHTALTYPLDLNESEDGDVFPLSLFPSAVREVHNLLSAEMVRLRAKDLFPDPDEMEGLNVVEDRAGELKEYLEIVKKLVPEVCAGHRGYVRLDDYIPKKKKKSVWEVGKLLMGKERFKSTLSPVSSRLGKFATIFAGGHISEEEVLTVTALLRVLDGCDVQSDRIVGEDHLIQRLERTAYEAKALAAQLPIYSQILEAIDLEIDGKALSMNSCVKELCELANKITPEDSRSGTMDREVSGRIGSICKAVYPEIFKRLRKLKGDDGFQVLFEGENLSIVQGLSLVNRIAFKWEQFLHFYKHRLVEVVLPVPPKEKGSFSVDIKLIPKEIQGQEAPANHEEQLYDIAKEITGEVDRTGRHLRGFYIRPDYPRKEPEPERNGN